MSDQLQLDTITPQSPRPQRRAGAAVPEREALHLSDYLKVLARRRWTALSAFLAVMIAVVINTYTATPIYRARVQLLIENENPNVVSFKEVINQEKTTNDYYQTQYRILQSRALARRALNQLGIWYLFTPKAPPR
jgi:succinoglycan biosynthesis transport protein ExoP